MKKYAIRDIGRYVVRLSNTVTCANQNTNSNSPPRQLFIETTEIRVPYFQAWFKLFHWSLHHGVMSLCIPTFRWWLSGRWREIKRNKKSNSQGKKKQMAWQVGRSRALIEAFISRHNKSCECFIPPKQNCAAFAGSNTSRPGHVSAIHSQHQCLYVQVVSTYQTDQMTPDLSTARQLLFKVGSWNETLLQGPVDVSAAAPRLLAAPVRIFRYQITNIKAINVWNSY